MEFRKASKKQSKVRLAITGPAGAGKTYTALSIAAGLGERVAVVDTEHGSADLYADDFSFDVLELAEYTPQNYTTAINKAATAGYDVLVLDSLTHAWNGTGGVLDIANGRFTGWKEATPAHNALIEAMVKMRTRMHIIATMRSKMEHVQETDERTKKTVVRKIGMQVIQRDEMPYEFDAVGDLDWSHTMTFSKARCKLLDGKSFAYPGADVAAIIKEWLGSGSASVDPDAAEARFYHDFSGVVGGRTWHQVCTYMDWDLVSKPAPSTVEGWRVAYIALKQKEAV